MSSAGAVVIYGATGFTGGLVARAAHRRGLRPVLVGRSEAGLRRVAEPLGLPYRVAALDGSLAAAFAGARVVLHAAGPYESTFAPVVGACLRVGAHYLDLSGEITSIEGVAAYDAEARAASVMLMPSVGFDVVASDCLCAYLVRRLPSAVRIRLGITGLGLISRGSARTALRELGRPARIRRDGRIVEVPLASLRREFDFGEGPEGAVVLSWADVATCFYTTGVPNIEAYYHETPTVQSFLLLNGAFGWTRHLPLAAAWNELRVNALPNPTDEQRSEPDRRAVVVATVEDAGGRRLTSRVRTPEVYTFSCASTLEILDRVLRGDLEPGFQTPARVYGADFLLSLPGTHREDLDVAPGRNAH